MKEFSKVVKEVNRTLNQIILFENLVNTTLIFLIFYLVLSIIDIRPLYALIPSLIYLIVFSFMMLRTSKTMMVEGKYAPLREKFRTAADNLHLDNPVVEELEYEVTAEMKNVGLSMFINPRILSYKIFAVMLLSFLIIFTSTLDIKFIDFAKNKVPDIFDTKGIKGVGKFATVKLNTSSDIFGKGDVAKLGDNELNIRIKPVDFHVNVKEDGETPPRQFETVFPKETDVKESVSYQENIPQEQQELVKKYFQSLATQS